MARAYKTITYRGGVVTFRVPHDWCENYDPDGGGEFFEDVPDSPTLRVNVITANGPSTAADTAVSALSSRPGTAERLATDTALVRFVTRVEEDGVELLVTRWEIAQAIPPNHLRIVAFTLTDLAFRQDEPATRQLLDLIDAEVRAAVLAPQTGVTQSR